MGTPYVKFGNIRWSAGWSITVNGGLSHSECVIRTIPHLDHLDQYGTLTIGEVGVGELRFRDCVLETPRLNADKTWELPILTREWKWRNESGGGAISGYYNIKRPDKTYIREKTPQELAELCLLAMGERNGRWDIGRLPNFTRPEVHWDYENPRDAFEDVLRQLGCIGNVDHFSDRVVVWPIGQGRDLPEGPTIDRSQGLSAGAKPERIKALSDIVKYQVLFTTESVGLDVDAKLKKLEDVSYAPLDEDDPIEFSGIDEDRTFQEHGVDIKIRDRARQTCHRTFRITGIAKTNETIRHAWDHKEAATVLPADGWSPKELKGTADEPKTFTDIQLQNSLAEQISVEDEDPRSAGHFHQEDKDIAVWAVYYDSENAEPGFDAPKLYRGSASVNARLGLVVTADPLYVNVEIEPGIYKVFPAEVYVDIAFLAGRDGRFVRRSRELKTGVNNGTQERIIKREDIECRVIQSYDFKTVEGAEGNKSYSVTFAQAQELPGDVLNQLKFYIDSALGDYEPLPSMTRHYKGLVEIVPDGKIRQVTWSGGGLEVATTKASLATEHNAWQLTYAEAHRKRYLNREAKEGHTNRRRRHRREAKE